MQGFVYQVSLAGSNIPLTFCILKLDVGQRDGHLKLVYYLDSLHCINLIKDLKMMFHVYAVLIEDIKDLIEQINVTIYHTLRKRN